MGSNSGYSFICLVAPHVMSMRFLHSVVCTIQLCEYTTICLYILLVLDIWVVSCSGLFAGHRSCTSGVDISTHFYQVYIQECHYCFLRYMHARNPIVSQHFATNNFTPTDNLKELFSESHICSTWMPQFTFSHNCLIISLAICPSLYPFFNVSTFVDEQYNFNEKKRQDTKLSKSHRPRDIGRKCGKAPVATAISACRI